MHLGYTFVPISLCSKRTRNQEVVYKIPLRLYLSGFFIYHFERLQIGSNMNIFTRHMLSKQSLRGLF